MHVSALFLSKALSFPLSAKDGIFSFGSWGAPPTHTQGLLRVWLMHQLCCGAGHELFPVTAQSGLSQGCSL